MKLFYYNTTKIWHEGRLIKQCREHRKTGIHTVAYAVYHYDDENRIN